MFFIFTVGLTIASFLGFTDPPWYLLTGMWIWSLENWFHIDDFNNNVRTIRQYFSEDRDRLEMIERRLNES